jgi:hypothetical protein
MHHKHEENKLEWKVRELETVRACRGIGQPNRMEVQVCRLNEAVHLSFPFLRDVTSRHWAIGVRRFETARWSHGSASPCSVLGLFVLWILRGTRCLKMSGITHPVTRSVMPQERRPQDGNAMVARSFSFVSTTKGKGLKLIKQLL